MADRDLDLPPSPTDFASENELSGNEAGIYAMSDGVTEEQFEEALAAPRD